MGFTLILSFTYDTNAGIFMRFSCTFNSCIIYTIFMDIIMNFMGHKFKIINVVIQFVAIFMMHNFLAVKSTSEFLFYYIAVKVRTTFFLAAHRYHHVSLRPKINRVLRPCLTSRDIVFSKPLQYGNMVNRTYFADSSGSFFLSDVLVM